MVQRARRLVMVIIASSSKFTPNLAARTKAFFDEDSKKFKEQIKKIDINAEETILYNFDAQRFYTGNRNKEEIQKKITTMIDKMSKSVDAVYCLKQFLKDGRKFVYDDQPGSLAFDRETKNIIIPANIAEQSGVEAFYRPAAIAHELYHYMQDKASNRETSFNYHDKNIIDNGKIISFNERGATAAGFVCAMQSAMTKEPDLSILEGIRHRQPHIYKTGLEAMGVKNIDVDKEAFDLDLSDASKENLEKARSATFREWDEGGHKTAKGYGKSLARITFGLKKDKIAEGELNLKKLIKVTCFNPITKKCTYDEDPKKILSRQGMVEFFKTSLDFFGEKIETVKSRGLTPSPILKNNFENISAYMKKHDKSKGVNQAINQAILKNKTR
jgi:hypothetical protein